MNGLLGTVAVADETMSDSMIRIRIARTKADMESAVAVRYQAYSDKMQGLADDVLTAEELDADANPIVLIAEEKNTGTVFATARLNYGPKVRDLLREIELPDSCAHDRLGYFSRMAAIGPVGQKNMARFLIHKAMFQICMARQITLMLTLVGRVRSKLYMPLGFRPMFENETVVQPSIVHGRAVTLLGLKTYDVERFFLANDPVRHVFFRRFHESIEVFNSLSSAAGRMSSQNHQDPARVHSRSRGIVCRSQLRSACFFCSPPVRDLCRCWRTRASSARSRKAISL